MTTQEAKRLTVGTVLYHKTYRNADGTPMRWRVNGKVRTWKKTPDRIQVPIKYGLKLCGYLNEQNVKDFELTEEEAKR